METIRISQSLIKKLFYKSVAREYCPRQIHEKYFLRNDVETSSDSMVKGIYFENRILGGTLFELPYHKRTGLKLADTVRIDQQVINFKDVLLDHLMFIHPTVNTQIRLLKQYSKEILLEGTLDWFPTFMLDQGDLKVSIIDLKLTKNIHSDFGEFCWGEPERMDWIQDSFYHELVHDIDWTLNLHLKANTIKLIRRFEGILNAQEEAFYYLVFDYKDPPEHKFVEGLWNYDKKKYLDGIIEKTYNELDYCKSKGWVAIPNQDSCKRCILDCPLKIKIEKR